MVTRTGIGNYVATSAGLPSSSQPWVTEIEQRLVRIENTTKNIVATNGKVAGSMGAWMPLLSRVGDVERVAFDAVSAGDSAVAAAKDTVTWSEMRPVSPTEDGSVAGADVPTNPDSTWFVYEVLPGSTERTVKEVWRWQPPLGIEGDTVGEWVQQKFGTDTLGEGAVTLSNLSASLSGDITTATNAVTELTNKANELNESYTRFRADVDQKIGNLTALAGSDGRTIVSTQEPSGADRVAGNLWINTHGGGHRPYAYDAATDTWVPIASQEAIDAARQITEAKTAAEGALARAQAAEDAATAARLAAHGHQLSADGRNTVFYQPDKPSLTGRYDGDVWFDTDDNYKMHVYDTSARDFVYAPEKSSGLDQLTVALNADNTPYPPSGKAAGTYWQSPDGRMFRKD